MSLVLDLAICIATPFLEYLIEPVGRQCGYILFYRTYLRELEGGVDKLKVELDGVQRKCDDAKRNAMDIETKVTNWIGDVNGAVSVSDTLLLGKLLKPAGANTVNGCHSWFRRCVCLDHPDVTLSNQAEQVGDAIPQDVNLRARKRFFYLNPAVCYKKGRKAKKTMLVVQGLNEDKKNLGEIFYEASTSPILSVKDYQPFVSRKPIVDNIIRALGEAEVPAIGLWGMGGVGKSTLMKEVIRLAREKNLFDEVAIAVVSQNPDVKKIQGELAVWLGLKFTDDETVSGRAARLHKRLKPTDKKKSIGEPLEGTSDMQQKQVLIVLDDIWRGLDLEEIGIPLDGGAVKLLFTSRKQHILSSEMGCFQNVFELKVLKDEEPWRLFESIVGEVVTPDTQGKNKFISIGKEVVEKCSGLPVVLKAIATTLKNCSLPEWEDALVQFRGSKDAYSNLEISYRHLESEELKSLFLVCAFTSRASMNVQDLLYYCMGLGLLITGTNTVRSARKKLKALLHDLQDSSLLLKDDDQDRDEVYIHDVVHEVAIRIASRDQDSLLITDEFKLKEIPRKKIKNSKAISIPYVKFQKLPEGWECPELKMFLLYRREDEPPIGISDSFFKGMKELSVLDISGRCFDSLPSSIQLLLSLNTLCLDRCSIEDLTLIGKLKQLQILSFIGSEIARLPKEIGELSELKVLNLTNSKLEVIEPQVLGKLTSLEELHLKGSSFIGWEDEEEIQPKNAKLSELNNLSNLSIVNIQIPNPGTIPKHLEFGNLAEYIIQIGDVWDWTGDYKESRMLKIKLDLCRSSFLQEKWVQGLLKCTQNLHLDGIKGWIRSIHELCSDGFQELKHLHLQNSPLVQCVVRSISKWNPYTAFTVLESLFLEKLRGLEMISRGPITADSFNKLKVIKVIECGNLKSLFSYSMLKCLSQLEEIEARDCAAMQVILTADSVATNNDQVVKLEALHRIKLHNLPNLMRFCSSHKVEVDWAEVNPRSSEIVQEDPYIPTNTMFPNDQLVSFPQMKSLILSSLPKLKYIWQNNFPVDKVANLEYLEVSSCDDLLIVIPSSLVKQVTMLETLVVRDCSSLHELFETCDALNLTSDDMEILSRLNNLVLANLPLLRHIWENNHQLEKVRAFRNLNLLKVVNCSSLMNLLPAALLKSIKQLREIYIKNCKEMKVVFPCENDGRSGETKNIVFESLVNVWLEDLPNMVTFVWTKGGESINFLSLKELYVKECLKMTSFCLLKEDESAPELCFFDDKVRLPKLGRLDLIFMSSIRKIWNAEILEESFCQLEVLWVEDCEALVNVIPSMNMTAAGIGRLQFQNLKEVIICRCNSLEQPLFKFAEVAGNGHYYSLSQLEKMCLFELPQLEHVVQPDSHVAVEFPSLVEIEVAECQCLIELFPIATATTLSKLQDLRVLKCRSMRQIFGKNEEADDDDDEMVDSMLFPCLRSIMVQHLDTLISFFPGISCMLCFPSLEGLEISWCSNLKTFAQSHTNNVQMLERSSPFTKESVHHYLFDDKVELPNLKKVELYELSTLQTVWKTKLPCLNICDRIGQIMEIRIKNCEKLEEFIFESDDNASEKETKTTTNDPAVFHSLANVTLENLPNMIAFIRGGRRDQSINFPFLKELYVHKCPKMRAFYLRPNTEESDGESLPLCSFFDHKVLFPKVEKLDLISIGSIVKIWEHEEMFEESFFKLESIIVKDCQCLVKAFPSKYVTEGTQGLSLFQNIKEVIIIECSSLEGSLFEFVWEEGEDKLGKPGFSLPLQLEKLFLVDLPKLEHVIHPTSDVVLEFQSLVHILITDCQCLIDIFPPSATTATLSKLEKVQIIRCSSMRYVFGKEEEEEEDTMLDLISFPSLHFLLLLNLNSLICFFLGNARQFDFSSLEDLKISRCSVLKTFVQRHKSEDIHYLFDDKVKFPNVQNMELYQLSSLQTIWKKDELLPSNSDSCSRLKSLTVSECKDLHYIFPASFASNLAQLEEMCIKSCGALEEIVMHGDSYGSTEELDIDGVNSSQSIFFFPQLTSLELHDLPSLRSFFRGSNVSTWSALKKLLVWHCDRVQIFTPKFSNCSNASTWPTLKKVWMWHRDKVQIFTTKFSSGNSSTRQSLFSFEQVIPKLEVLRLVEEDVIMIQDGESKENIFTELKKISLACFHNERSAAFPSRFMLENNFEKLETLTVFCSSFEEVFADESLSPQEIISYKERFALAGEGNEKPLASLRELKLSELHNLKHVWKADMTVFAEILKSIQLLEVTDCPALKNLFLIASCSFGHITTIKVHKCNGMHELVTSSAATSLVKLTQLDIYDCGMIETIVSPDESKPAEKEDGELLVICFRELKYIGLHRLPSLTSFSSANCTFELPSLEEVIVIECPNLEVFSSSSVVAPKLSKVLLTEKEQEGQVRWDGDLNTTIQNLPKS